MSDYYKRCRKCEYFDLSKPEICSKCKPLSEDKNDNKFKATKKDWGHIIRVAFTDEPIKIKEQVFIKNSHDIIKALLLWDKLTAGSRKEVRLVAQEYLDES